MTLAAGSRIGAYEILGALGAGGMGEVYRARDTRLKREVALKVLPPHFTADADRLARFQREAEVLASLNHPNIAHLHGLEDTGATRALVMELVEGEDLAQRLLRGPVPLDEALPIARQIADALAAAHEQGIIHRDLKPANVKVRPDGTVKVLDFGLAKALESSAATDAPGASALLANSPTITSPALTMQGMLLGTAAYMSPEQAKGKPADARSDIWAFGCVLYELLTGRRAFDGEDVTDTLASIVRGEPEWRALPAGTPDALQRALRRCLARNRASRLADIRDATLELDDASREAAAPVAASALPAARSRLVLLVAVATAAMVAAAATSMVWWWNRPQAERPVVTRFTHALQSGERFTNPGMPMIAVSPDGTRLAYIANFRLFVRDASTLTARPVNGAEGRPGTMFGHPVFSPDGQWIAFYAALNPNAAGAIRKVPVSGGVPITVTDDVRFQGMSWDESGIVFVQRDVGVMRVAAEGGTPQLLASVEKGAVAQGPRLLPNRTSVLFAVSAEVPTATNLDVWDKADIVVQAVGGGGRKRLIQGGSNAQYLPSGHLVFTRANAVLAVPFDLDRLETTGSPVAVVDGVNRTTSATGGAQVSVSESGVLAYIEGLAGAGDRYDLVLIDRDGVGEPLRTRDGPSYAWPRFSPDAARIVFGADDGREVKLWIYDLTGASAMRQLAASGNNRYPLWSNDGRQVVFQSDGGGPPSIFRQPADGSASAERLTMAAPKTAHFPESWSPDGRHLLFSVQSGSTFELWVVDLAQRAAKRLLVTPSAFSFNATFAPDGKWFAYVRRDVGKPVDVGSARIFVEPFPPTGAVYPVDNGLRPLWSRDGKELFFGRPGQSFVVPISTTPTPTFGNLAELPIPRSPPFGVHGREYDATPDGRRFVFSLPANRWSAADTRIQVVMHWFDEVTSRVPTR